MPIIKFIIYNVFQHFFLGYVDFLLEKHPEIVEESIMEAENFSTDLAATLVRNGKKNLDPLHCAEMLIGKCNLSQRAYQNLKYILGRDHVKMVSYEKARDFANNMLVPEITKGHQDGVCQSDCFFVYCSMRELLSTILKTKELFKFMTFPDFGEQKPFIDFLMKKDPLLYSSLKSNQRTIFLRATGDNFRASKKFPTEQISFNIMNITNLLNSPYGQFIMSLFRGSESKDSIELHCKRNFQELDHLLKSGIEITFSEDKIERFNVVIFFVADLGLVKEVIGKCSSTGKFGCYRCVKKIDDWHAKPCVLAQAQTVQQFKKLGELAESVLGKNPNRNESKFKTFQQNHFGQWVRFEIILYNQYFLSGVSVYIVMTGDTFLRVGY